VPGLPEREVRAAEGDRVSFVMRRVADDHSELAWARTGADPPSWRAVAEPGELAEGEELLPMFPVAYPAPDGLPRRVYVGLVPTTSVETQANTGPASTSPPASDLPRGEAAWVPGVQQRITDQLDAFKIGRTPPAPPDPVALARRDGTAFLLLDLAEELVRHYPDTWRLIAGAAPAPSEPNPAGQRLLYKRLLERGWWTPNLRLAWQQRDRIWGEADPAPTLSVDARDTTLDGATLLTWLKEGGRAADGSPGAEPLPAPPGAALARVPKLDGSGSVRYRLRCVFQRPACGPLHDDVTSAPTEDFTLASFFDPDAPGRPVHIAMPFSTSVKDLRKFRKTVSIELSSQLRSQMSRATDIKEVVKGNLQDGEPINLGMICSFSIPIITIVALILLMLFVIILNLNFWWLPFLRICFPVRRGR
jgi:hypothetical protein